MTASAPLISVITIVKNNEKLLPRAIDSALSQTETNLEIVVVNDGSTDDTRNIIDSYRNKDSRVRAVHLKENVGRSFARNIGLEESKGIYLTFLDADDYLPETAISDMTRAATEHKADIVLGRIRPFDMDSGQWKPYHYMDEYLVREQHGLCVDDYPALLNNHSIVGRCYLRDFLMNNGILFSTLRRNAEDVTFSFYSEFKAQRISIIPDRFVYYYSSGNFLATANLSKVEDARDSVSETLNYARAHGSPAVVNAMFYKAAIFAGNLERTKQVFGSNQEIRDYLPSLLPLLEDTPKYILDNLPPYYQRFGRAIRCFDFNRALYLFENKHRLTYNLPRMNTCLNPAATRMLAIELEELYYSRFWLITFPLRKVSRIYSRFFGKTT